MAKQPQITIDVDESNLAARDALYCRYSGQTRPQRVHLEIDPQTDVHVVLKCDWVGDPGGGRPMTVHLGHQIWIEIPAYTATVAKEFMHHPYVQNLVERIARGYSMYWDGSNLRGGLNQNAEDALQELQEFAEEPSWSDRQVAVYDAGGWLAGIGTWADQRQELGITAETTDAELAAIAKRLIHYAAAEGIDVLEDLDYALEALRETADDDDES